MLTDAFIALFFTIGTAIILYIKREDIKTWGKSKHGKSIKW